MQQTTPASIWKQQSPAGEGDVYTLPGSGHIARLVRPSLMALAVKAGQVPNTLSDAVIKFLIASDSDLHKTDEEKIASYRQNVRAYFEVAALCMVSPRLVLDRDPNYDADEVGPEAMHDRDIIWLYYDFTQGSSAARLAFRAPDDAGGAPSA